MKGQQKTQEANQYCEKKYTQHLQTIPPTGCGCHPYLLGVSNYGVKAGLSADQIFSDIRNAIPEGKRRISDREISDAIHKALADHNGGGTFTPRPQPKPLVQDMTAARREIVRQGKIRTDVDLWESSPRRLWSVPEDDAVLFLTSLYDPDDHVFIGGRYDAKTVMPVSKWLKYCTHGGKPAEHFCINPLSGHPIQTGEKETWRGDANVIEFRYVLVEFDNIPKEDQTAFWSGSGLPVCCLIDSAGKSIHGLLDAQQMAKVATLDEWRSEIKGKLYNELLTPLGCDGACSNPARLSRMPGHYREGKGIQKILWLAGRKGKPVL